MALSTLELAVTSLRFEYPMFEMLDRRIESFVGWPCTLKQKPTQLAEAGFFYSGMNDKVICFGCGGGLKHWTESDIPWEQHALWFKKCEYLKLIKGQKYIDQIHDYYSLLKSELSQNEVSNNEILMKNDLSDNRLCKICYESLYNTVFLPCAHIIACTKCANLVTNCPYCRQRFTKVVHVYLT